MSEISQYTESLHEECGVFGMYDKTGETDMVSAVYSALYALQHRGQESCGIALNVDGVLTGYRDLGLVSEVFTPRVLADLPQDAKMATGHVRYRHQRPAAPAPTPSPWSAPLQGHYGHLPQRQPDQCRGAAPPAGKRGRDLPRLLGH